MIVRVANSPVPAYQRIKLALLDEIKRGAYPPDRSFITEREICRRFGVSRATAVRTMSELVHEGVVMRQRGRGSFVIPPLDNVPFAHQSDGSTRLIGCIFHHLRGNHPMAIIQGIEHVCRAADYHLLLFDSEGSAHTEARNLARARKVSVHGLIVYPTDGFANTPHFEALGRDNVPLVLIDRYYPALPTNTVVADNFTVGYELTEALIRQGHRAIATIWEETSCTSVQDRLAGYRQALKVHGIPLQPELAALRPYLPLPYDERRARLTTWLDSPYRPTAYLTANSECLVAVTTDLMGLGVTLPGEVEMASMDNSILDMVLATRARSVTLPSYEMGRTAMSVLLDQLAGANTQLLRQIVLPVTVSASVGSNTNTSVKQPIENEPTSGVKAALSAVTHVPTARPQSTPRTGGEEGTRVRSRL